MNYRFIPISLLSALLFSASLFFTWPAAAETGTQIQETLAQSMAVEKKTQAKNSQWQHESQKLAHQLKTLELRKAALDKRIEKQHRELAHAQAVNRETKRQITEAKRVKEELNTFLESVLERLDFHIQQDLPFLGQERHARLESLKEMMVDPDNSAAERFRRVFEALQIETEYGNSVEVTQETISLGNTLVLANIFRLGRVSLFCQTPDQKKSGLFDPAAKQWKPLPDSVNDTLSRAISMARLERSVELVKLPLGRIQPQ